MDIYDVIIIGGGPAGLNAAVVLGRCRRKVLLFDHGKQRNRYSHGMHNYLTRDGMLPADFFKLCHKEIKKYNIKTLHVEIKKARKNKDEHFVAEDCEGKFYYSKKLILATGLTDILPEIKGVEEYYGKSLFHCPYCDAWEFSDKKIGVYSINKNGFELAKTLSTWSKNITLYADGKRTTRKKSIDELQKNNIKFIEEPIQGLEGRKGKINNIVLKNGKKYPCDALFFSNGCKVQCDLVEHLGCTVNKSKIALTNKSKQTNISGLYVAGDASKDMHFVVVAAAEGATAAVYINKELLNEEIKK